MVVSTPERKRTLCLRGTKINLIAGLGFEPRSPGYEPDKETAPPPRVNKRRFHL